MTLCGLKTHITRTHGGGRAPQLPPGGSGPRQGSKPSPYNITAGDYASSEDSDPPTPPDPPSPQAKLFT